MDIAKLRSWTWLQQGLNHDFESTEEVLNRVGAVYSTNPCGPLSLLARMKPDLEPNILEGEKSKKLMRTAGMRGSVYIMQVKDHSFISSAGLPNFEDPSWDKRYAQPGRAVDPDIQKKIEFGLSAQLSQPVDIKNFRELFNIPQAMAKPMVNKLCFQGKMLRVGTESKLNKDVLYVSSKDWFGKGLILDDEETAIKKMAILYFKSFAPASLKDFCWWLSIPQKKGKPALEQEVIVEIAEGWYLHHDLVEAWEDFDGIDCQLSVLPQWDCYTMGYAPEGRKRLVEDEHLPLLYGKIGATGGNAVPCVLENGKAVASWKHQKKGDKLNFAIMPFNRIRKNTQKELEAEFEYIAQILDAKMGKIEFN